MSTLKIDQKLVEDALREIGLERSLVFEIPEAGVLALTGWKSTENPDGDSMVIEIKRKDEEGIYFISIQVLSVLLAYREAISTDRLSQLLMAVGYLNYRLPVVKVGYDPGDGEIRFSVEAFLILGDRIKECIQEAVKFAIAAVDKYKSDLVRIRDGHMSFDELLEKEKAEKIGSSRASSESKERRMLAGLLKSIADHLESTAKQLEESGDTEVSEQSHKSSPESQND